MRLACLALLVIATPLAAQNRAPAAAAQPARVAFPALQSVEALGKDLDSLTASHARYAAAARELVVLSARAVQLNEATQPLLETMQAEERRFQTLSNASKARHDIAMNAIRNLK